MFRKSCEQGIFIDNSIPDIVCLMFADDVANCAETVVNLQRQINTIDQFCISTAKEYVSFITKIITLLLKNVSFAYSFIAVN